MITLFNAIKFQKSMGSGFYIWINWYRTPTHRELKLWSGWRFSRWRIERL